MTSDDALDCFPHQVALLGATRTWQLRRIDAILSRSSLMRWVEGTLIAAFGHWASWAVARSMREAIKGVIRGHQRSSELIAALGHWACWAVARSRRIRGMLLGGTTVALRRHRAGLAALVTNARHERFLVLNGLACAQGRGVWYAEAVRRWRGACGHLPHPALRQLQRCHELARALLMVMSWRAWRSRAVNARESELLCDVLPILHAIRRFRHAVRQRHSLEGLRAEHARLSRSLYLPLLWKRWRVRIVALKGAARHATASDRAARPACRRRALRAWRLWAAERRSLAQSVAYWEQRSSRRSFAYWEQRSLGAALSAQSVAYWEKRSLGAALERLHHQAALARVPAELLAGLPTLARARQPSAVPSAETGAVPSVVPSAETSAVPSAVGLPTLARVCEPSAVTSAVPSLSVPRRRAAFPGATASSSAATLGPATRAAATTETAMTAAATASAATTAAATTASIVAAVVAATLAGRAFRRWRERAHLRLGAHRCTALAFTAHLDHSLRTSISRWAAVTCCEQTATRLASLVVRRAAWAALVRWRAEGVLSMVRPHLTLASRWALVRVGEAQGLRRTFRASLRRWARRTELLELGSRFQMQALIHTRRSRQQRALRRLQHEAQRRTTSVFLEALATAPTVESRYPSHPYPTPHASAHHSTCMQGYPSHPYPTPLPSETAPTSDTISVSLTPLPSYGFTLGPPSLPHPRTDSSPPPRRSVPSHHRPPMAADPATRSLHAADPATRTLHASASMGGLSFSRRAVPGARPPEVVPNEGPTAAPSLAVLQQSPAWTPAWTPAALNATTPGTRLPFATLQARETPAASRRGASSSTGVSPNPMWLKQVWQRAV